jgi:hypothetical protein
MPATTGGTPASEPAQGGPGPSPGVTDTEIKIGYLLPITGAAPVPVHFENAEKSRWSSRTPSRRRRSARTRPRS